MQLVFSGEVLDGFQPGEVKLRMGQVLKLDGVRLDTLFSGRRCVLKGSLGPDEAQRRAARLAKIGARVRIEPMENAGAALSMASDSPSGPASLPEAAPKQASAARRRWPGRMGRRSYAASALLLVTAAYLLLLLALARPGALRWTLAGLGLAVVLAVAVGLSVLRWRDGMPRSGWRVLLLAFSPGMPADNAYGPAPRRGHAGWLGGAVLAMCLGFGLSWPLARTVFEEAWLSGMRGMVGLPSAAANAAFHGDYEAAPLHKVFAVSASGSWGWRSDAGSLDSAFKGALASCEARREPGSSPCHPVNIDGQWVARERD